LNIRVELIRALISLNENILFYPKLKQAYKKLVISKNPIILDVGTNRGQSIDFFLKNLNVKTIIGFEPNQKLFNSLIRKYKDKSNIKILNNGVSSRNKSITFYENILDETSSFEKINLNSKYAFRKAQILGTTTENLTINKYYVKCIRLSEFLIKNRFNSVDILKVDVEGHEYEVLKGLFSSTHPTNIHYIQLESHNDDLYLNKNKEIHEILLLNNFNLCKSINHSFGDFKELIYVNISFKIPK
tara:strand:+ start:2429 stop:3160 length:732 start_codon:yes stop_codon:yes gene_type:complete